MVRIIKTEIFIGVFSRFIRYTLSAKHWAFSSGENRQKSNKYTKSRGENATSKDKSQEKKKENVSVYVCSVCVGRGRDTVAVLNRTVSLCCTDI